MSSKTIGQTITIDASQPDFDHSSFLDGVGPPRQRTRKAERVQL
jgi:hypothetical protein